MVPFMKNLFMQNKFILLFFITLSFNAIAQNDSTKCKKLLCLKTDLAAPIIAFANNRVGYGLSAEFGFSKRHSVQLSYNFNKLNETFNKQTTNQLLLDYKLYLQPKKTYTGFYTGLYLKHTNYHVTLIDNAFNYQNSYLEYATKSLGGGLNFGYQNYVFKKIVIDVILGLGARSVYQTNIIKQDNIYYNPTNNTFLDGRFAVNIGYRF